MSVHKVCRLQPTAINLLQPTAINLMKSGRKLDGRKVET
jgi:hypothetical protein